MLYPFQNIHPQIAKDVFIAPGARIIGDVVIKEGASIWYNAVLRGDEGSIVVGKRSNVQDNSTVHLYPNCPVIIGDEVTVGHNVILHGCQIGSFSLIGMGSTILDGVEIGEYTFVAANSFIPPGKKIPPYSFVLGSPAQVVREVSEKEIQLIKESAEQYAQNAKRYLEQGATR